MRIALVGIGNELNGDDAAGVLVARALSRRLGDRLERLMIEGGPAPENFTGPLRRFQPDLTLLVDSAAMDVVPGTVEWLEWEQIEGLSASTHTLPPTVLATFLIQELGCRVGMIGIQPERVEFDRPVTPAVMAAVKSVTTELERLLA